MFKLLVLLLVIKLYARNNLSKMQLFAKSLKAFIRELFLQKDSS